MITIRLEFQRLCDITLYNIYDEIGVYVLWNGHAKTKPSYIGEGDILHRFASHTRAEWSERPLDGLIAIVQADSDEWRKAYAEIAEATLLEISEILDRFPTHNKSRGKASAAIKKATSFRKYNVGTIKLVFEGRDPLLLLGSPIMKQPKTITWKYIDNSFQIVDRIPWNQRPEKGNFLSKLFNGPKRE